jgi:UDP-N-acetylmuramoyl-L-alanyl-D-glutamate--2,6-diaminopimelate ligase
VNGASPSPTKPSQGFSAPLPMLLSTLIDHLGPTQVDGPLDREVQRVTHDSRDAGPADLFVAIRGERVDARRFVPGLHVAAVIADAEVRAEPAVTVLTVPDARKALAQAAAALAGFPATAVPVVGITGTNGKTTVCWMLESIGRAAQQTVGIIGTTGHRIGDHHIDAHHTTPEAPRLQGLLAEMRDAPCGFVAMEVSSIALDLRRPDGIAFRVAVFTNLSRDHLDHHGDMAQYLAAKARLFAELVAPDGIAILNIDDPASIDIDTGGRTVWTYGQHADADFNASVIESTLTGSRVCVASSDGEATFDLPLLGAHNVANATAAFAAARALGISAADCVAGLGSIARVPGRLEAVPNGHGLYVLVDYAHTPDALDTVLRNLRMMTPGRVLTVFGCGGDRDAGKRAEMGAAASARSDRVYITSDNPRTEDPAAIIADILPGVTGDHVVIADRRMAIATAIQDAQAGDVVLIAGKGHEDYQIIGDKHSQFDDRVVAAQVLRSMGAEA